MLTTLATDPDFDPERVIMDLRLTFDGLLLSTGSKGRPSHVHEIRQVFHPQLRLFWKVSGEQIEVAAKKFSKNGYRFVPLVQRDRGWICAVSVLLLRPSGAPTNSSDQLATMFDALVMPRHGDQLKGHEAPGADENPFFCLLEDDSLITQVSVETGLLLQETKAGLDGNAARAVISVQASWPRGSVR